MLPASAALLIGEGGWWGGGEGEGDNDGVGGGGGQ